MQIYVSHFQEIHHFKLEYILLQVTIAELSRHITEFSEI
jgi:hypothetical protein